MKLRRRNLLMLLALFLISCGPARISTGVFHDFDLKDRSIMRQSKGNINIEVNPIKPSEMYKYPQYFCFTSNGLPEYFSKLEVESWSPVDEEEKNWSNVFGGPIAFPVFYVKIDNNTDHILRMTDSRIYLISDNNDPAEAIKAIGKSEINIRTETSPSGVPVNILEPKSVTDNDGSLVDVVFANEVKFRNSQPDKIYIVRYPVGISSYVIEKNKSNFKLLNQIGKEILPGMSYSGLVIFPIDVKSAENPKLKFYDITVKTDAAGTPIEKVAFEFPIAVQDVPVWFDVNATRRWIPGQPPAK